MIKKFAVILLAATLLVFSCKTDSEVASVDEEEIEQVEISEVDKDETSVGDVKPEKSEESEKQKKPTPKKQEEEKKPKIDPSKSLAEKELKKANSLLADCKAANVGALYSKELSSATSDLKNAEKLAKGGNYSKAKTEAEKASVKFETLLNLNDANNAKTTIVENQFGGADAQSFSNAEIAYIKALENYENNHMQALEYSKTASNDYAKVLDKGYVQWSQIAMENATKAKANCDSIKASKSTKAEYKQADELLKKGINERKKKNYEEAHKAFVSSSEQFTSIYDKVSVRRAEALQAMKKANIQQQISSELAAEADAIVPLTPTDEDSTIIESKPEGEGFEN